jgi:hypothetical protein
MRAHYLIVPALQAAQSSWAWAPLVAAGIAGVFALVGILATLVTTRRDRRRELYADAFRTALALVEMVYRVQRADAYNARAVADHYHQIHEDINFHQGWIESESEEMGRAYRRLLLSIRAETRASMREGWGDLRQLLAQQTGKRLGKSGGHPNVTAAKRQFLEDVSDYLSWTRRKRVQDRYSERGWRRIREDLPDERGGTFYDPPHDGLSE